MRPISFQCSCGKAIKAPAGSAGKKAKCPACNAVVEVPSAAPEPDLLPDPPAPPPCHCPKCGAENPSEQEACLSCGEVLGVGASGGMKNVDGVFKSETPFEKPPPFPIMVLGMFYRPAHILEYFRVWAEKPAVLVQLVLLYVGSLGAISVVAAAGYLGPRQAAGLPAAGDEDTTLLVRYKVISPANAIKVAVSPDPPVAGKPTTVRVFLQQYKVKQPLDVKLSGTVAEKPLQTWDWSS